MRVCLELVWENDLDSARCSVTEKGKRVAMVQAVTASAAISVRLSMGLYCGRSLYSNLCKSFTESRGQYNLCTRFYKSLLWYKSC